MSGIKGATVRNNLNKVVNVVRSGISECERSAAAVASVGKTDFNCQSAEAARTHAGVRRQLPSEVRELVGSETARWEALLRSHDERFEKAGELTAAATEREAEFQNRKRNSEERLARVNRGVEAVRRALQGKDWYCDEENHEAKRLRSEAEGILAEMRRNVDLGRQAQVLRRKSLEAFAESERLAQDAEREYERLVNLSRERREQQRIKEENERKAKSLSSELASLRRAIEAKNYTKFGGSVYTSAERRELEDVVRLIDNGRYESAIPRAEALKGKLAAASSAIAEAQRAWEAEKLAAERVLVDAREEMSKIDRDQLVNYSGAAAADIAADFSELSVAAGELEQENFGVARTRATAAVEKIRALKEKSDANRRLSDEREEMSQAIMQALYDANFDTPEYYLQDDGDALSDMCVVAAAPGGVGDMKLRINIAGETKFEVCNIPEGHEQLCVNQIRNLQKNLAESDIRFDMTDWGRAENQGRVHVDVRPKEQTTVKTIQRQG